MWTAQAEGYEPKCSLATECVLLLQNVFVVIY